VIPAAPTGWRSQSPGEEHSGGSIGLADAMTAVLAREFRTDVIATLDRRHFRMICPMTRHDAFRLLPDDVPGA
jgi:hypothetical protein